MSKRKYEGDARARQNAASAAWKRRNRVHAKKKLREWMKANAPRRKKWVAAYLAKTKATRKLRDAERNRAKRGDPVIKARKRAYMRKWLPLNRHRHRAAYAKRKALKKGGAVGNQHVIAEWFKKWRSLNCVMCFWCKKRTSSKKCHGDHIIPLAKGGAHSIENLCVSCGDCNRHKHDKPLCSWNAELSEPVLF